MARKPPTEKQLEILKKHKAHQWVKGESGNPAGKPKGIKNKSTLIKKYLEAIVRDADGKGKKQPWGIEDVLEMSAAEIMVLAQVHKAMKGDTAAFRELMDGAFGKSPDIVQGDPDAPIMHQHKGSVNLKGKALIEELAKRGLPTSVFEK